MSQVASSQSIIHHPLFPSLLATHSVTVADGHRHYKSASSQPSTITSEDIKKKLTETGESNNNNNNGNNNSDSSMNAIQQQQQQPSLNMTSGSSDSTILLPIQQDESSVVNQLCNNFLVQTNYPSVVESEIPSMVMNSQQPSQFDQSICGLAAITALHKMELQTMYHLCEDFIDQMQHTLHIDKQNAKYSAKQRIQHPNVYSGTNVVMFMNHSGGVANGTGLHSSMSGGSGGGVGAGGGHFDSYDPLDASPNLALDQHPNGSDDGLGDDDGDYPLAEIKKTEDVVKELKKRYSGEVLTLAKKKKNFSKSATDVLNVWFFQHLHDPYPSDDEKRILSQQTGLSLSQVNNWFGNKRMRYKRKMLEQNRRNGQKGAGASQAGGDEDDSPQQLQFHNDQDFNFN